MSANHNKHYQHYRLLRSQAELSLTLFPVIEPTKLETEHLVHELQVHQIELEMQNEELRQAYTALEESRDRYIDLYEFAPIGYLTLTLEGIIIEINLAGATLLGVERKKLINRHFARFVAEQDQVAWYRLFQGMMRHSAQENQHFDLLLKRNSTSPFHAHFDCLRRESKNTSPVLRLALTDISPLKQSQAELRIAATAFESHAGVYISDTNSSILKVNRAFTKITGYSAEEAIGQTPSLLQSGYHHADFYVAVWESLISTGTWHGEIWNQRKNGEIFPAWITITAVHGDDCTVRHYIATMTDITEQKTASKRIEQLAFYDSLTNLPNRRLLKNRLHLALAASMRSKQHGALLSIDLDHFKTLNDTLGHNMGDLLLQQVAQRLLSIVRENDTAARLGGDEFIVMLEDLGEDYEEATIHAEIAGQKYSLPLISLICWRVTITVVPQALVPACLLST
ncbi:diguanylate cyclase domain-containing protein [Crenothrix sp.]|uniref:sensor domain-containing protein n=1 Tax=Crenothrix sp. TaxID=3100433 RepID=UPI00374D4367